MRLQLSVDAFRRRWDRNKAFILSKLCVRNVKVERFQAGSWLVLTFGYGEDVRKSVNGGQEVQCIGRDESCKRQRQRGAERKEGVEVKLCDMIFLPLFLDLKNNLTLLPTCTCCSGCTRFFWPKLPSTQAAGSEQSLWNPPLDSTSHVHSPNRSSRCGTAEVGQNVGAGVAEEENSRNENRGRNLCA